jgi:hypothetical protein
MKNTKKTIVLTSLVLAISFLTIAQRNVPFEMYTIGTLDPSQNPPVLEDDNTTWSFLNRTNCDISLNMIFHLNGNTGIPYFYDEQIIVPRTENSNTPGFIFITNSQIYNHFGLTGTNLMSHLIFEMTINGVPIQIILGATQIQRISVPGCGTICWIPDLQNKTFEIIIC